MDTRPAAIVIPEAVPLDLETASIGSRFLGLLIDWSIQGALLVVLLIIVSNASVGWLGTTIVFILIFLIIGLWLTGVLNGPASPSGNRAGSSTAASVSSVAQPTSRTI